MFFKEQGPEFRVNVSLLAVFVVVVKLLWSFFGVGNCKPQQNDNDNKMLFLHTESKLHFPTQQELV